MFTNKVVGVVGSGLSSYACISRLVLDPSIKIVVLDNDKESVNFIDSIQKKIKEQANYINDVSADFFRFSYSSPKSPSQIFEYNLKIYSYLPYFEIHLNLTNIVFLVHQFFQQL